MSSSRLRNSVPLDRTIDAVNERVPSIACSLPAACFLGKRAFPERLLACPRERHSRLIYIFVGIALLVLPRAGSGFSPRGRRRGRPGEGFPREEARHRLGVIEAGGVVPIAPRGTRHALVAAARDKCGRGSRVVFFAAPGVVSVVSASPGDSTCSGGG